VKSLHCEGGGELIRALAELDVIDDFHLTLAGHTVFGGWNAATATGLPGEYFPASKTFDVTRFEALGHTGECFVSYRRVRENHPK
jgi:riboflavin biosynthesis pyrimidine reductase